MGTSYHFSQTQLKVLLSGSGYDTIIGVGYDSESLSDEMVVRTLNDLTNGKLISANDRCFEAIPSLQRLIYGVGEAKRCFTIRSCDLRLPDLCLFFGEVSVLCTVRTGGGGDVVMEEFLSGELFDRLMEEGYIPEEYIPMPDPDDSFREYEDELFSSAKGLDALPSGSSLILSIEMLDRDGVCRAYLRVIDYYLYDYIVYELDGQRQRAAYSTECLQTVFEKMMQDDYCRDKRPCC